MDGFGIAYKIIDLVGQAEYLIVVRAHTLGHDCFINANHVPMAYLEFLNKEWKEWYAESNFAWFGSCNIIGHCRTRLKQVVA